MSKLLKCPFCGGEAKIVKYCGKKTIVYVECSNCLAYMGNQRIMTSSSRGKEYFESEEKLINAWNARKPMDNIVEKLEERERYLEKAMKESHENGHRFSEEKAMNERVAIRYAINIVKQENDNGLE